jgi:hypothetical protein
LIHVNPDADAGCILEIQKERPMKASAAVLAFALTAAASSAQVGQQDHSRHHPGDSASAAGAPAAPPNPSQAAGAQAELMKKMQDMRERMRAAATPQARRALMDEHLKLMQAGTDAMIHEPSGHSMAMGMGADRMAGGADPQGRPDMSSGGMMGMHAAMEGRMAMMEMMMQMMVDREAAVPRK